MKKLLTLIFISVFCLNAINAEITWTLSDDGTLTISGTDMPNYFATKNPWYSQRNKIKRVIIDNGVKNLGRCAFDGCRNLASIVIPNSVTSIGEEAFYDCSGLTSITIPTSVTSIDLRAFYNCSGLTSIVIPNSVTSIGEKVFTNCTGLTSITIGNSVTSIGNNAFNGCNHIRKIFNNSALSLSKGSSDNVSIPYSVMAIYNNVSIDGDFRICKDSIGNSYVCDYLGTEKNITIPNGIYGIAEYAFYICSGLTSVTIPNSVKSIGGGAFRDCNNLVDLKYNAKNATTDYSYDNPAFPASIKTVTIGNDVETIPAYFICKNTSITSITIPNSVTSIGGGAFYGCSGLTSVTIPNRVTSIGGGAFYGCSGLTSVTIPNSVTCIGDHAFYGCSGLTSITIPNRVTSIGGGAFYGCSGLTSITIPNSVTIIGAYAFYGCSGLTSVTIPNSVTCIGDYTFAECNRLTSITIPNSVIFIDDAAFLNCSSLTSITIPESVISIGYMAFSETKWYKNQPDGLIYAGSVLYKYKGTMPENTKIEVKEGTKGITGYAFCDCSGLISITIPNSVTSIGNKAFQGTQWYKNQPDGLVYAGLVLYKCKGKLPSYNVWINGGTKGIADNAFESIGIASITIPNSVTHIGRKVINGVMGLKSITLPNSITTISSDAFYGCFGWSEIICKAVIPPLCGVSPFFKKNYESGVVLYVPASAVSAYRTASVWNEWKNIMPIKEPASITVPNAKETLVVGTKKTLEATIMPEDAMDKTITWTSSNTGIATVSAEGIVTAKSAGTAVIIAKTDNGLSAECTVTVIQPVTSIALNTTSAILKIGETKNLTATTSPTTASNTKVEWSSSDIKVASVSATGVITAKGKGTCTITCTAIDGYGAKKTCSVTVIQPVTSIALNATTASLRVGETKNLTATVSPTTANNTKVEWSSSDTKVATVSSTGVVTAKGKGTCTIICTAADGYGTKSTCSVTVKQPVTAIALSDATTSLWVGETKTITATVTPTSASDTAVKWSSSDTKVATVSSDGTITAIGTGSCTITCTAADGYGTKSTCKVTVKQQVNSIDFENETLTITCGTEKVLTPTITPSNADVQTLAWKSTDKNIAEITSKGVLKAVSPGTATITCTSTDGFNKQGSIKVNVVSFDITDDKPNIADGTYGIGGITYTRAMKKDNCDVFCMPYDIDLSEYTDFFNKVYVLNGMAIHKSNGTVLIPLKEVTFTETIPAGQPFVAYAATSSQVVLKNSSKITIASLEEPKATKLDVYDYSGNSVTYNPNIDMTITGNYAKRTGLDKANTFVFSTSGLMSKATTVSPYRFYITKNDERSSAKITDIQLSFDGEEATAVEDIINEQKGDGKYYNLNGQRINKSNAQKGVYIINGKKVVVK